MADETERAVYVQRCDPDQTEEYVAAHDDVPAAVTDAMERGGVENFELYVRDDVAVCILECADLDAYLDAVEGDEDVAEWERYTGQFKREGVDRLVIAGTTKTPVRKAIFGSTAQNVLLDAPCPATYVKPDGD